MAETTDVGAASLLTDEGPTAARLSFKLPHDTVRDEPPLRPGDGPGTPAKPESGGSSAPRSDSGVVLRSTADAPAEGAAAADKAADDDEPPTILRRAIGTSAAEAERTLVEINKNPERPSPPPRAPDLEMPTPAQPLSYEAAVRSLGAIVDTDPEDQTEVETLRVSGPQMPLAPIEAAMLSPPPAKLPTAPAAAASAAAPPAAAMPPAAAKVIAAALAPPGARAAATAVAIATGKPVAPRQAPSTTAPAPAASATPSPLPPAAAAPGPAGILPLQRPKTATLEDLSSAPPPSPTPARAPTPEELDAAAERLSHPPVPEMPRPRVATETIPLQLPISDRGMLLAFVGGVALVSFIAGLVVRGCFVDETPSPPQSAESASPPAPAAPAPVVERAARPAPPPAAPHAQPAAPPAKAPVAATPRPPAPPRKAAPPPAVVRRTPSPPPRTQPAPRTPAPSRSASPPPRRVAETKRAPAPTKRGPTAPPRAANRRQGPAQPGGFLRRAPF